MVACVSQKRKMRWKASLKDGVRSSKRPTELLSLVGVPLALSSLVNCGMSIQKKKITIVHAEERVLNSVYPNSFRKDVEKRLRSHDVKVVHNTRIDDIPSDGLEGNARTADGKTIDSDLVVPTRGGRPATAFLSSLSPNPLDSTGHVKVKKTLQLVEETNILAVGDCNDIKEQKQLGKAGGYAELIAGNVLSLLNGKDDLKEYKGQPEAIFITIGKRKGAGWVNLLWGLHFGNWTVSTVKGKGLFISLARKELGQA